ncbi:MAG: hypothetical protein ACRCZF_03705, partial [Gemmataceae bacterium]
SGVSTENVEKNVRNGTFGTWDETARFIHMAIMLGALEDRGFGESLGRFINHEGGQVPSAAELIAQFSVDPGHPRSPARAELLQTVLQQNWPAGSCTVPHPWKRSSIVARAEHYRVPFTVHPGIGYDIISNHPIFCGGALGRAAEVDFKVFAQSVNQLDGGVVLSVGSAIMAPQVFEKSLSVVNNLRVQAGQPTIAGHTMTVVDLQDGGGWDWSLAEPPKNHPAYYLRFCKSFSRMGGTMHYAQCDNLRFMHQLHNRLLRGVGCSAGGHPSGMDVIK